MNTPENLTTFIADAMSAAGYDISDQLYNALEKEFTTALETDQEEGNFSILDTLLGSLEYAVNRACIARSNQ